jgi:chemotaxis protein CheC
MELTENQKDALTELINIGYARAAGALSQLTGHRIRLEVPKVAIHAIQDLTGLLSTVVKGEVASVTQIFTGPVSGNALLLLDDDAALLLTRLLMEEDRPTNALDFAAREVITEVGNIVLNACLGVFGNLLKVQVTFSVPRLHVESVEEIFETITVADRELQHALMVHTQFYVKAGDVAGYLVIVLGVTSLDRLLFEVKQWEERQLAS